MFLANVGRSVVAEEEEVSGKEPRSSGRCHQEKAVRGTYSPPITTLQEHSHPNPRKSLYPKPWNFVPLPESHENPVFSPKLSRSGEGLRFYPANKPTS